MTIPVSTARYAVYFAPAPDGALWRTGSALLGYDAATGDGVPQKVPVGIDADAWTALTEDPRRYGFHATLKAPFRLRDQVDEAHLIETLEALARTIPAFEAPLAVTVLDGFVALTPLAATADLRMLADAAVEAFEPHRAALTTQEIARRRPDALTPRQRENLDRYGYPYFGEDFRFHMTLSGRLGGNRPELVAGLRAALAPALARPTAIDSIALFRQDGPASRFRIVGRASLR